MIDKMSIILFLFYLNIIRIALSFSLNPILVVVDSFEPFIKHEINKYCEEHEIQLLNVLSS